MTNRPTGVGPRGRWARFLQAMRKERDWSQTQAFEALREGLNLGPKSRASYYNLDVGRRVPTIAEQEFLVRYFGRTPDDIPQPPEEDEQRDELIVALDRQVAALTELAGLLRRMFEDDAREARLRSLEAAVALLVQRDDGSPSERSAPRGRAE